MDGHLQVLDNYITNDIIKAKIKYDVFALLCSPLSNLSFGKSESCYYIS